MTVFIQIYRLCLFSCFLLTIVNPASVRGENVYPRQYDLLYPHRHNFQQKH